MLLLACGTEQDVEEEQKNVREQKVMKVNPDSENGRSSSAMQGHEDGLEDGEEELVAESDKYKPSYKELNGSAGGSGMSPKELMEFGQAVFSENGTPSNEVIGDMKSYATADIKLQKRESCGTGNCGKEIFLVNSNLDRSIALSVESSWKLGENYSGQLTDYEVSAGAELFLGCSHYCRSEGNVPVKRKILGAVYR